MTDTGRARDTQIKRKVVEGHEDKHADSATDRKPEVGGGIQHLAFGGEQRSNGQ